MTTSFTSALTLASLSLMWFIQKSEMIQFSDRHSLKVKGEMMKLKRQRLDFLIDDIKNSIYPECFEGISANFDSVALLK